MNIMRILFLFCLIVSLSGCVIFKTHKIEVKPITYSSVLTRFKNSKFFNVEDKLDILSVYVFRKPLSGNLFCLYESTNDNKRCLYEVINTNGLKYSFINMDFEELLKPNKDNNYYHRIGLDKRDFYIDHVYRACEKKSGNEKIGTNFSNFIIAINQANEFLFHRYGLTIECYPMIKCIYRPNDMRIDVVCITNVREGDLCYFYDQINGDSTIYFGSINQGFVFSWFLGE